VSADVDSVEQRLEPIADYGAEIMKQVGERDRMRRSRDCVRRKRRARRIIGLLATRALLFQDAVLELADDRPVVARWVGDVIERTLLPTEATRE